MERVRVEEFRESKDEDCGWVNLVFFLGFLSQNSLWKLSTIHGYKGYLYWCVFGMQKVSFSQTKWSGDLASWLDWVESSSRVLTTWPTWDFCPVIQQLAWLFSSSTCFTRVPTLATCQQRASREIQLRGLVELHTFELFFTLSHILPLHDSHLNTEFLSAKLQANWHEIKPTKWLFNFNLTISLFGYSVTKP